MFGARLSFPSGDLRTIEIIHGVRMTATQVGEVIKNVLPRYILVF